MNETAHARALSAASFIESDALSIRSQCSNLGFWLPRMGPVPAWRTNLEAQLDGAEHELLRALEHIQKARMAVEASRLASVPRVAAE